MVAAASIQWCSYTRNKDHMRCFTRSLELLKDSWGKTLNDETRKSPKPTKKNVSEHELYLSKWNPQHHSVHLWCVLWSLRVVTLRRKHFRSRVTLVAQDHNLEVILFALKHCCGYTGNRNTETCNKIQCKIPPVQHLTGKYTESISITVSMIVLARPLDCDPTQDYHSVPNATG